MRMGIYSNKVKDVKDLPDGATISIPNDPTNEGRGLQLLEKAGVIKLKEGVGMKATPADVVENPKNIQFKEIEAAQLPRSLDDVDASVITMNYVMSAGLSPEKQGIFLEDKDTPLAVMIIAVRERIRISLPIRNSFKLISLTLLRNSLLKNTKAPSFLPGTNRLLKQKALEKFPFPKLFYWGKPDKPDVQGASSRLYAISSRPSPPGEPFFHGLPCWGGHHRCTILFRRKGFCKIKDRQIPLLSQ